MNTCSCARRHLGFGAAHAALLYGGSLVGALLPFKHAGRRYHARALGGLLVPALQSGLASARAHQSSQSVPGAVLVTPVPLHPRRLRQRGYNQALELARQALGQARRGANILGEPGERLVPDLLRRVRDTPSLGTLGVAERKETVSGAFAIARPKSVCIADRAIVLVDDVMTTGATLSECAQVLRDAGAGLVVVAVLARAV